ncbi:MAG: glycosyltransferase family 2 protein [Pseudomonadota bacterium]
MPLVSIALSTYNGERHLRDQLDSVLAQAGVDFELVAVDDGSRDGTTAILNEYAARDGRLRWSRNPRNLGPTRSFERAIALCTGEFIAPCDQDDVWLPHKLQRLVEAIGEADLAYADSAYVNAEGRSCGRRISDDTRMLEGCDPFAFLFANSVSGHAALVRRDCALRAMPYPAAGYHDWWLALSAAGGRGVRYVDEVLVQYRRHDGAYCGMGGVTTRRDDWLGIRRALVDAYARRGDRGREAVAALSAALQRAAAGDGTAPLARELWAHRTSWPRRSGLPGLDALALGLRLRRKLRRSVRDLARVPG